MVRRARAAGLSAIALTDHDTVDGVTAAVAEGARLGIRVIGGCEFSVQVAWGEMHLLGYFLPPDEPAVAGFLAAARDQRLARARQMVEHLQAWGVDITADDVLAEAAGAAVGRPHVARALLRKGKVPDIATAFDEFLGQGRRAYVEKVLPSLREVADLVHRAGGLVSAAHLRDRASRTLLRTLKDEGLDAVEVRHPSHSPELSSQLEAMARHLELLPTGGSDWHGDGAGEGQGALGGSAVPEEWLDALEHRVLGGPAGGNPGSPSAL